MFYYIDIDKISKIDISDNIKKELELFINDYYDRYSGLYLKSKDFLDKYSQVLNNNQKNNVQKKRNIKNKNCIKRIITFQKQGINKVIIS